MFRSGTTTFIISNEEINDIMRIVKSLEEPELSIKGIREKIKNEAKKQKGFLSMLFDTLGASLLENILAVKGIITAGEETIATSLGRGTIRPHQNF